MSEESFLRYRLDVVRRMPDGAYKRALFAAINASLAALRGAQISSAASASDSMAPWRLNQILVRGR